MLAVVTAAVMVGARPRPGKAVKLRAKVGRCETWIVEVLVPAELAPAQLGSIDRGAFGPLGAQSMPHLKRAQLAPPAQVGRQATAAICIRTVAALAVVGEAARHERGEPLVPGGSARRPHFGQSAGPVRRGGKQLPRFQVVMGWQFSGESVPPRFRNGQRLAEVLRRNSPPERGEDLVLPTRFSGHFPRLVEKGSLKTRDMQSRVARPGFDAGVDRSLSGTVPPVPVQPAGTNRRRGFPNHVGGRSAAEQQGGTPSLSRSSRRAVSEWWSHQRAAPPWGRIPGDSSSRT